MLFDFAVELSSLSVKLSARHLYAVRRYTDTATIMSVQFNYFRILRRLNPIDAVIALNVYNLHFIYSAINSDNNQTQ